MDKQVLLVMTKDELDSIIDERIARAMASLPKKQNLVPRKDAAKMLRLSETTLWRWERTAKIKGIKIGRAVCYREDELSKVMGGE